MAASGASVLVTQEQEGLRQSSHRTLQEGRGLEMAPIALVAADAWLVILFFSFFFSELLTFLMAENGNAEALP